jgi:SAM-dependent methyltransferase
MPSPLDKLYDPMFYQTANRQSLTSARVCVPLILDLLNPVSVIDVGCGQGEWLSAFVSQGIGDALGVDGPQVADEQLLIPKEKFLRHDLSRPLRIDRRFDLATSLEVAEHLPPSRAPAFIAELTRLAPAVVFSAAVPGQGGVHHINEQWPWYWKELFASHGFVQLDPFRRALWKQPEVAVYYQTNLFLFVDPAVHHAMVTRVGVPDRLSELTLVRTTLLQDLTAPGPIRRILRKVRKSLSALFGAGR